MRTISGRLIAALRFYPFEIGIDAREDFDSATFAELGFEKFERVALAFSIVATANAVTEGEHIRRNGTGAFRRCERYPVIGTSGMCAEQVFKLPLANCAAVVEIVECAIPILRRKYIGQSALSGTATGSVNAILLCSVALASLHSYFFRIVSAILPSMCNILSPMVLITSASVVLDLSGVTFLISALICGNFVQMRFAIFATTFPLKFRVQFPIPISAHFGLSWVSLLVYLENHSPASFATPIQPISTPLIAREIVCRLRQPTAVNLFRMDAFAFLATPFNLGQFHPREQRGDFRRLC